MLSTNDNIASYYFVLPTTEGTAVELASDNKTTVLYFFAPWCQICHASIGNLQQLSSKNKQLTIVAIALDFTSQGEVAAFTQQHQLTFSVAFGNVQVKHAFKISGYPSYYVVNEENTIIAKSMGYSTELGLYLRSL